jgi:RND family efflux transporter MFP subunit
LRSSPLSCHATSFLRWNRFPCRLVCDIFPAKKRSRRLFKNAMDIHSAPFEIASISLACRDRQTLLKTFAVRLGTMLGARAVLLWLALPDSAELACEASWFEAGEKFTPVQEPATEGILAEVLELGATRRVGKQELDTVEFAHLEETGRLRVKSALYGIISGDVSPVGIVELLNTRGRDFSPEEATVVEGAGRLLGQAIASLRSLDSERSSTLSTIERLTALYDLGRTFTSTLEIGELLPIVAAKVRDNVGAEVCNLWLVDARANELYLAQQAGEDLSVNEQTRHPLTEGLLGDMAHQANPRLITEPLEESDLSKRQKISEEFKIVSWMGAPLRKGEEVLGVVELINKPDQTPFDEDDLFFLSTVAEQAAVAIHNARLLESERRMDALGALLKISQQITSTLDLDHVLMTVVNQAATVLPFDRCVMGFFDRGRFVLGAVSGEEELPKTREMDELREQMEWVANQPDSVSANLNDGEWHLQPEHAHGKLVSFLEAHGYRGFRGLALHDEQGKLGAIGLLNSEPNFLNESHSELLTILANQTTVAIRNAQLYQQVPLANILRPLSRRKKKLLSAVPQGRWVKYAERLGVVALILTLVPWPMRVETNATVVPAERRIVSSMDGGVVKRVYVREGDFVEAGQTLSLLENGEHRVKLVEAEAAMGAAGHELAQAQFRNDPFAAGQAKIRADLHAAEVQFEQQRLAGSELRAPIAGMVVTPKVEERTGTMLKPGEGFCEIVAQDELAADMSVPEMDLALLKPGDRVALKFNARPMTTFHGRVDRIGAQTRTEEGEQYFVVRAVFQNQSGSARDGMLGKAKISSDGGWFHSGWYPVGYVLLRSPVDWLWRNSWSWLP